MTIPCPPLARALLLPKLNFGTLSTKLFQNEFTTGYPKLTTSLHAHGSWVIIDPLYEAEKIGSLYIPRSYANRWPQQGNIVDAGPGFPFLTGSHVFLRPFVIEPLSIGFGNLLAVRAADIIASLDGKEIVPKPTEVVILPDWSTKYGQPSKVIVISDVELEDGRPIQFGIVARIGSEVTTVKAGDYVIIPPDRGVEIGFIDTVWYILEEADLLATIERAPT